MDQRREQRREQVQLSQKAKREARTRELREQGTTDTSGVRAVPWIVGDKVWVWWRESKGDDPEFQEATVHSTRGGTKPAVSVILEGATRESNWILKADWDDELRRRGEGDEKPEKPKARRSRGCPLLADRRPAGGHRL